jgi:hypothetical protein
LDDFAPEMDGEDRDRVPVLGDFHNKIRASREDQEKS